jgi:hypothetical protein
VQGGRPAQVLLALAIEPEAEREQAQMCASG